MYYLDLTIQFIAKMTMQIAPAITLLLIVIATITVIKNDTRWLRKAINKIYMKML